MKLATRGPFSDAMGQIFRPVEFETLADLFVQYKSDREKMEGIASFFDGSNADLVQHFAKANADRSASLDRLFELERALKALDASYWDRALRLTDILETMPQKRRDNWNQQISDLDTPTFDEATVLSTLQDLLAQRHQFFAERVDGIFRSLSHEHVTNRPEGFSKRMIVSHVYSYDYADWSRCGTISDLRCVIARFMGREEPRSHSTTRAVEYARRDKCGQWVSLDGGCLRIRLYKKGTAHLEVHPEMAWRLNAVLASIHPNAIPEKHRVRTKAAPPKDFKLYNRPIPAPVVEMLSDGRMHEQRCFEFNYYAEAKSRTYREACDVLTVLGGVSREGVFYFDYNVGPVLREVIVSGMLPDRRVHQFYPTPRDMAEKAVAAADIEDHHTVLEPSAGQGGIADHLPNPSNVTVIEAAPLHCQILRAKGYDNVIEKDFLRWKPGRRFDRIIMNPPFTKSQWKRHLEHASTLLAGDGRLVAVLPSSAPNRKDLLPGWSLSWSEPSAFPGTSIEVVILTAERGGA